MNQLTTILLRIGIVAIALVVWFWTQRLIALKATSEDKIGDRLHEWTASLHGWFLVNPKAADATLIVTSALIDLFGLFLVGATIFGPTSRPFLALLLVFSLRQLCQAICSLPYPDRPIWRNPGFPSLLVTYGTSNDFFFSGHTSIAMIGALEIAQVAPPWLAVVAVCVAILEAATVIVLRAHYTIDVFAAVFAAWASEFVATRWAPVVDLWFSRIG
ncbi:MAG: phosphatase PAP2-related protein [Nibricoccus sp.]